MTARRTLAFACWLALVMPGAADEIVRAADYQAFWLWAGVRAPPEIGNAATVYLLQGEVGRYGADGVGLKPQGGSEPSAHKPDLWLVYRVRSLDWTPDIYAAIVRRFSQWRAAPGRTVGVQLDFDASTRGLGRYAEFLRAFRARLPEGCALGVTGLMDWAAEGDPAELEALSGTVDEVIFQTYRGSKTVADIDAYVARLQRLDIPFRLGLAEGALWSPPGWLAVDPHFRGYVVFLRNAP